MPSRLSASSEFRSSTPSIACWPKRFARISHCRPSISPRWTVTRSPPPQSKESRPNFPLSIRVAAGSRAPALPAGSAARIFTGSAIPAGADTVVMQEHVRRRGAHVVVDGPVRPGSNIRRRGEDIAPGEFLLDAGQRVGPHHIALLAAQGIVEVCVRHVPRVVIASTGDELRQPGEPLGEASIYDSNRPMLLALARQAGLVIVDGGCIPDNRVAIANRLADFAERPISLSRPGARRLEKPIIPLPRSRPPTRRLKC